MTSIKERARMWPDVTVEQRKVGIVDPEGTHGTERVLELRTVVRFKYNYQWYVTVVIMSTTLRNISNDWVDDAFNVYRIMWQTLIQNVTLVQNISIPTDMTDEFGDLLFEVDDNQQEENERIALWHNAIKEGL